MAKGRIRSRMELREQYDAAEAREREERDEGDEEGDEEAEAEASEEGEEEAAAPVAKKKKATKAKESKPRAKKAAKVVRRRVVWIVFDNSNKKIAQYDFPKKAEAEEHAARLATEKKQTYFVQPYKEEIAE